MEIGTKIKQLRFEQNVTQEELAQCLRITSRSVSQWECGRTCPDISQLPALANFFGVTTDTLLGVDIARTEEEIDKIIKYNQQNFNMYGERDKSVEYLTEKLKVFPNQPKLISALVSSMYSRYCNSVTEFSEDEKNEKAKEIIALCKKGIKYDIKSEQSGFFKQIMVYLYIDLGRNDEAEKIVTTMNGIPDSYELLMARVLNGREALKAHQDALLTLLDCLLNTLDLIRWACDCSPEKCIEMLNVKEKIINLIVGEKPNFFNDRLCDNSKRRSWAYKLLGDKDKALDELERAIDFAEAFENRPDSDRYEVYWLSEIESCRNSCSKSSAETCYGDIAQYLDKQKYYESFAGDERFEKLTARLSRLSSDE